MKRRIVVTICPREHGTLRLPVERGGRARRMNAREILRALRALVAARRLGDRVAFREACAGGCAGAGPNISVEVFPIPPPGVPEDHVAIGWRYYTASLDTLDCLARIVEENLAAPQRRPGTGSRRRSP